MLFNSQTGFLISLKHVWFPNVNLKQTIVAVRVINQDGLLKNYPHPAFQIALPLPHRAQ